MVGGAPNDRLEAWVTSLRGAGERITTPRRLVLTALASAGSHVTAEELHDAIASDHPEINLSTVYRCLHLFAEHGLIRHVHLGHGPAQYHLGDDHHLHAVCETCGAVAEVPEEMVTLLRDRVRTEIGYELDLGHFALTGTCPACSETLS